MAEVIRQVTHYQCNRCNYEWAKNQKRTMTPAVCPKCHSPYWNRPRTRKMED